MTEGHDQSRNKLRLSGAICCKQKNCWRIAEPSQDALTHYYY
jgi:hypothetical protein